MQNRAIKPNAVFFFSLTHYNTSPNTISVTLIMGEMVCMGRVKFVFLRSEYSELKCGSSLESGSLHMSFEGFLDMPANLMVKPYNKGVMRYKCITCI